MPFAHTHREDFSKKNGVCQLFSRRFTGICRNLSISGKIKPLNRLSLIRASPRGAFLAELPHEGNSAAWCRRTATNEGRSLFSNCLSKVTLQKKLSASFRGFPSGGSSLRSKVMRGAACLYEKAFPKRKAFSTFDFFTFRNSGIFHRLKRLHQERFSFHREAKKS